MTRKVKVLYIVGWGRSGSTILGNILGQMPGFFHAGEFRSLWDHSLAENVRCGCGQRFRDCELWGSIVEDAFSGRDIDVEEMRRLRDASHTLRSRLLMLLNAGDWFVKPKLQVYLQVLQRLYDSITLHSDCRVVIDSSKMPSYGNLLSMLPGADLYAIHLVRDPRAVAYSWLRTRFLDAKDERNYMPRYSSARSAWWWCAQNLTSEVFCRRVRERSLFVRYEDFVEQPRQVVERIVQVVGEQPTSLPFVSERTVALGVNHTLMGNPGRFETGAVTIRPDEEWRNAMRQRDRLLVTALTLPFLLKYGYRPGG